MASLERTMQQCRKLCLCTRRLDRLSRVFEYRMINTKAQRRLDPFVLFMMPNIQNILKRMTGCNMEKVFETHKADMPKNPKYYVLSKEELIKEQEKMKRRAEKKFLAMPPYMDERPPCDTLLSADHDIAAAIPNKMVFVDVSLNFKRIKGYNHRPVVVRHPNGELRNADWDTYDRMSQIFYPVPDRKIVMPKMFEEANLENILGKTRYRYILDRACVQFEPDSADFIRVTRRVFEHITKHGRFDDLRSTRYFGLMVFYLCHISKIDALLLDMINRGHIEDAADVINIRQVITFMPVLEDEPTIIIRRYIEKESDTRFERMLLDALDKYEGKKKKRQNTR